ncbi:hypothetical protein LR48_Vigan10g212600 [Vigna angularis]|uniref:Uncharacterized protein n=1 Tax=Phaseolus angularis TaxID=3914 RepID=A0A0L9VNA7_PHAAN|nr:hypothetical protein LR48_Vigan10g212600 [Vigna angularis]
MASTLKPNRIKRAACKARPSSPRKEVDPLNANASTVASFRPKNEFERYMKLGMQNLNDDDDDEEENNETEGDATENDDSGSEKDKDGDEHQEEDAMEEDGSEEENEGNKEEEDTNQSD